MRTPSLHPARKRPVTRALATLALAGGVVAGTVVPAHAAPGAAAASASPAAAAVLSTAASLVGTPYRYGGAAPGGFDCSGFTSYVFGQHGIGLQRTADAQMRSTRHVPADQAAPGDLVFFTSGGRAYHAAIYAGDGRIFDAGRSGGTVSQRGMWTNQVVFGRVLA